MSVRRAVKALADSRALEEQAERTNPLGHTGATPSMGLSEVRGGGATPSMGLSQIRGGKRRGRPSKSDAMVQGKALKEHLHSLHGEEYAKDFVGGMSGVITGGLGTGRYEGEGKMKGGFWGALASLAIPVVASLLGKGKMTQDAHDELMDLLKNGPKAKAEKKESSKKGKKMKGGSAPARMVGAGPLEIEIKHDAPPMEGCGKKKRGRPASAMKDDLKESLKASDDSRKRRGAIVKRIMKEKGLGLPQASKYVKEHNLA